jgi:uncharacterized protein YbjT (DUF2867 family)
MSRSGKARTPDIMSQYPSVEYVKGDCLEPDSFKDVMQDVDGVIHTVGVLVEGSNPKLTYAAMNRDTCNNMARVLNDYASPEAKKNFAMVSSAKGPPGLPGYLTTKIEAEEFLMNECPNINPYIVRPGFIWNKEHRGWSVPLRFATDALYVINENVMKRTGPLHKATDFLFPAKPTKLETVGHFTIEGVMGNLDSETHKIVSPEMMIAYEAK